MKAKFFSLIISFILIAYYYVSITTTYSLIVVNKGGWYLGEWIINYQDGGFKRRGLFGSLFILINEITHFSIENIVFYFLLLVYTLFFFLLAKALWKEKNNLMVVALLLLPAGFGMMVKDPTIASKKEIIFFLFYLFYILSIRYKVMVNDLIICIFILVAILTHEAAYFYLPIISFTYFVKNENSTLYKLKKIFFYQFFPSTILMLILFKYGLQINTEHSVAFLKSHGLVFKELGIYEYNTDYDVVSFYKANIYSYQTYMISLFIGAFTFYLYCKYNSLKLNGLFLSIQIIFLIPLFYLALDWGRWINILFSLLTIFTIAENKAELSRKQEIFTLILIIFNSFWAMMLKTVGFVTFPALDDLLKKLYYYIYFKLSNFL